MSAHLATFGAGIFIGMTLIIIPVTLRDLERSALPSAPQQIVVNTEAKAPDVRELIAALPAYVQGNITWFAATKRNSIADLINEVEGK